jgi:hypothetical protein
MWKSFKTRTQSWSLVISNPTAVSTSEATKQVHELRVLNLLLPTILDVTPERVWKRESPDFEVTTTDDNLYVELVDAVPDAISASSTMNLAQRRSRENPVPYHVENEQFGETSRARSLRSARRRTNGCAASRRSWESSSFSSTGDTDRCVCVTIFVTPKRSMATSP